MTLAVPKLQASGMRDLFRPLDDLLVSGGDPRLKLDPLSRLNQYGCAPAPAPDSWSFASCTASTISDRAYARVASAREELMRAASAIGLDAALDARLEEMRSELRAHLGLGPGTDVVFAASGTDAQLQALFLARARVGVALTTIVVGSDQTGSGTAYTARGHHFGTITAAGHAVRKDDPVAGLACDSIALPLINPEGEVTPRTGADLAVLVAIERAAALGTGVLLQIMDCSKLGWRAPSEACLAEIASRWPEQVQIVVDACQMRLGRGRIKRYLDRGYPVLITGSKYFGGPAFSAALLVPAALSRLLPKKIVEVPTGLLAYTCRSDWPNAFKALRSRLDDRNNLGQWLRWEAALEEMRTYYALPDAFRVRAVQELRAGIEDLIKLTPALGLIGGMSRTTASDDEEFSEPTILPFTVSGPNGPLSPDQCRALYLTLIRDMSEVIGECQADRDIAALPCLPGQPVRIERADEPPVAVLRLCIGARLVTESWSSNAMSAFRNLEHQLDCVAGVITKIELLLAQAGAECMEPPSGTRGHGEQTPRSRLSRRTL
jgi:hypothetical protein